MDEVRAARRWLVFATLLFSVCGMIGVLLPWAHGLELRAHGMGGSSIQGFWYVQGILAFAGAFGLAVVSALRASKRIRDGQYLVFGTAFCLASFAALIWFWSSEVGSVDPIVNSLLAFWDGYPRITAGAGWYATVTSVSGGLLCLGAYAVDATAHLEGLRIVHDDRNLGGGSLVPNRLRFRIVSRASAAE